MNWDVLAYLIPGLSNGLLIALVALGYSMVYGVVGLINFAHGDLVMLGGFATLTLIGMLPGLAGIEPGSATAWTMLVGLVPLVAVFGASVNWGLDRIVYRPLRSAPKLTSLVSAIGVSFILINIGLLWGALPMSVFGDGRSAASAKDVPDLLGYAVLLGGDGPVQFLARDLLIWVTALSAMLGLSWFVTRTRTGTAMRACAQDAVAARLMGIDADRVIGIAFLLGGALAGIAGLVYACTNCTITYTLGFRQGLDAFAAAVLGGIGKLPGAVLGALIIGLVRSFTDAIEGGSQWTNAAVFAVLIAVLVLRPGGILGAAGREKV